MAGWLTKVLKTQKVKPEAKLLSLGRHGVGFHVAVYLASVDEVEGIESEEQHDAPPTNNKKPPATEKSPQDISLRAPQTEHFQEAVSTAAAVDAGAGLLPESTPRASDATE